MGTVAIRPAATRSTAIDVVRGLAVLLMVADHVALVFLADVGGDWYRLTLGRVAMPLFFILAGHLASTPGRRHVYAAVVGFLLPLWVAWLSVPNVLVSWALGACLLWLCRRYGVPVWALAAVALTLAANGWILTGAYDPAALVGLMALGSMVPRRSLVRLGDSLPVWLVVLGRRPLTWYVAHLLILDALWRVIL